jgi:hypothetical protein
MMWRMSLVLWYSVLAFQCLKVWKVIFLNLGLSLHLTTKIPQLNLLLTIILPSHITSPNTTTTKTKHPIFLPFGNLLQQRIISFQLPLPDSHRFHLSKRYKPDNKNIAPLFVELIRGRKWTRLLFSNKTYFPTSSKNII